MGDYGITLQVWDEENPTLEIFTTNIYLDLSVFEIYITAALLEELDWADYNVVKVDYTVPEGTWDTKFVFEKEDYEDVLNEKPRFDPASTSVTTLQMQKDPTGEQVFSKIELNCKDNWWGFLPDIIDELPEAVQAKANLGKAKQFMIFDPAVNMIEFEPFEQETPLENYSIVI